MISKGFTDNNTNIETPNDIGIPEKPLKNEKKNNSSKTQQKKVDINVLKSRVQEIQNKENKKNIIILVSFISVIGTLIFYLSA